MEKNFVSQYNFWSVGQGLFVTMKFNDINVVYDCGSVQKKLVDRQVEKYVETLPADKKVNIIFISHFHEDHINGIFKLLECINKVDYVFIPYIPLPNRIYILMNLLKNLNYLRDNHVIRLVEFIFDPLSYIEENFSNKVGERVVVVIEGKEKRDDEGGDNISEKRGLNINRRAFFDEGSFEAGLANRIEVFDTGKKLYNSNYPISISEIEKGRPTKFIDIRCFNYIGIEDLRKMEEGLEEFKKEIIKITQGKKGKELVRRLLEERKMIKNLYEHLNKKIKCGNFNHTSLCVLINDNIKELAKKVQIHSLEKWNWCSGCCIEKIESINFYNKELFTTLLTGDINLKNKKIRNKLLSHFKLRQLSAMNSISEKEIDLFVVPHHGSKSSWSNEMLKYCDELCILLFPITCRCFARFGEFPSSDVRSELKKKYFRFSLI